ncbi:hypothetical protein CPB85DRAFT_1254071 [Mucidula mucida]|nr:hypothetical protein CPB85DRAFT_1254071 [Mucidula mucida]
MGVLGLAGVTTSQVQAYLSVTVGDKPPVGMDLLVRTVCQLLPGYVYASNTPPQYPRRLLHKLLPALKELCFERNSATIRHICGPLVNDVVDLNMFMAARTLYVRGQHLWHSHINDLRLQRRVAKSPHAKRFRHRYHDFQADQINATSSMKDVFVPVQPDPLFAYCVDAGLLTVSFDTPDKAPDVDFCYQFPGHSVYRTFRQDIIDDVDQSGLAIRQPFDGSPEWIFDAMDPYLKKSRSTLSNPNAPKNTFQSIRTSIMHMAEAHTGAHTYDAVMEAEMGGKHRADSVVLLPQRNAMIVIEDKTIRLFDFLEGTMGIKLERWPDTHTVIESKLTKEHWRQAEALAAHLRKLHPRVFMETEIPDKDIPNASTVPFRTFDDLPTELRHFFFMGWVNKVYGRHSIFSLLSSAECQGRNYELNLQCGQVNDKRFDCRECRGDKKNFITVIVVIMVGGVRVLARCSRLTTNKRCSYYLVHTGKNPS